MLATQQTFNNEHIKLQDGDQYLMCTFSRCTLDVSEMGANATASLAGSTMVACEFAGEWPDSVKDQSQSAFMKRCWDAWKAEAAKSQIDYS